MADEPHLKFLKHLKHSNYLNNSVLFYYSDHGLRFGNVRQLYVGKMEERLPFMFLVFPNWFMKKFPEYANNLRTNSRRLTTPFDIYETLTDILYFKDNILSRQGYKNRGMSLFKEIPKSRTCENAGILPHWCTCAKYRTLPTSDVIVRNIALFVVSEINRQLFDVSDLCADLSIQKIRTAGMLLQSDKVLRFQDSVNDVINRTVFYGERAKTVVDYQLTLQTHPGGGVFEATVQYNELIGSFKMMTEVSRINKYGHQSDCITSHALKKFCFCIT
ncbi:hypothetical protein FSP39_006181 [Pinctada imbricata]|uniref:Uncharacterized protein n=1 Tax=Pinctada imbricata TaxID=66713 RepID=A0AA88Y5M9_PINIB|nr:hypothetical protein FSP39_006181 [Pinctada imbricata]